ncbi:MAG: biotin--[acetyl-CoA-carboxylase] ligase [Planctomycetota bacterium]|jgi:BirA family biotin operon repressor/biotin-[acetyl-CoA-carboxylase] ligase
MSQTPLEQWATRLQRQLDDRGGVLRHAHVVRETASTQDAARRLGARPGTVVVAGRQTAGRGRLGRRWNDTREEGVAVTMALDAAALPRLPLVMAVATAETTEVWMAGARAGIKWPNDVLATDGRKLAGVLIERADGVALIGVGINVNQTHWGPALSGRATSLYETRGAAGSPPDRLEVVATLLERVEGALQTTDNELRRGFVARDVLVGRLAWFRSGRDEVHGRVLEIDPLRGLLVEPEPPGPPAVWLAAATTRVVSRSDAER